MRHEIKKISRIVDELTTLFLRKDTREVDFKILLEDDRAIIRIVDYGTNFDDDFIEKFRKTLNKQRQAEIEEYYWQLAGEIDQGDELILISAMIDEAKVEKRDGNLYIELIRLM
ncbi:hypothetical protein [Anaerotalea alkaliphila]|uniref:Na+-translocating membrane potential-generating system MpsC domain-containing protein n=1 Tax=Anaerotalea alkaliphila TaxID=2662126 RepID=A0A7X5HUP9_9FIRM|nr:hypothetical protein [Anaerotalea alkaliphila]NDL66975.1 hypothetical protein [Anaerotalea alkaliphila]